MAATKSKREQTDKRRNVHLTPLSLAAILALSLGVTQAVRVFQAAFLEGGNNLSTDYIAMVPIVDRILAGNWANFLHDSCVGSHYMPLSLLAYAANAALFHWDVRMDIGFGLLLALARTWLLADCLTVSKDGVKRLFFIAALLAVNFGATQLSVLLYGQLAVAIGLTLFGFTLALWGLVRFAGRPAAAILMAFGGLVSSLSWGNVLPCWVSLGTFVLVRRGKKWWEYALLAFAALVSAAPYLWLFPHGGEHMGSDRTAIVSLFNLRFILNSLGRMFGTKIASTAGSIPLAEISSIVGVILLAVLSLIVFRGRQKQDVVTAGADCRESFLPSYILVLYGLSTVWFISAFRWTIAPWYVPLVSPFWIGLMAIAYRLACPQRQNYSSSTVPKCLPQSAASGLAALVMLGLYLKSNISYHEQNLYIDSRTPASESTLRNFAIAPTYLEPLVFEWGGGNPDYLRRLAEPLLRRRLSCFAPHQQWSLQGDFALPTVNFAGDPADILWTKGESVGDIRHWDCPEHLNLALLGDAPIKWTVSIPKDCRDAVFQTAVIKPKDKDGSSQAKPACAMVDIQGSDLREHQIVKAEPSWRSIVIPLNQYRGQRLTISLGRLSLAKQTGFPAKDTSNPFADAAGGDALVFNYPRIDVCLGDAAPPAVVAVQPGNTELSPYLPATTDGDLVLDTSSRKFWRSPHQVEGIASAVCWTASTNYEPISNLSAIAVSPSQYSHLYLEVTASESIKPRLLTLQLLTNRQSKLCYLPLLNGSQKHKYTYDLKLPQFVKGEVITGLSMMPLELKKDASNLSNPSNPSNLSNLSFVVDAVRFIHR